MNLNLIYGGYYSMLIIEITFHFIPWFSTYFFLSRFFNSFSLFQSLHFEVNFKNNQQLFTKIRSTKMSIIYFLKSVDNRFKIAHKISKKTLLIFWLCRFDFGMQILKLHPKKLLIFHCQLFNSCC